MQNDKRSFLALAIKPRYTEHFDFQLQTRTSQTLSENRNIARAMSPERATVAARATVASAARVLVTRSLQLSGAAEAQFRQRIGAGNAALGLPVRGIRSVSCMRN